MGNCRITEKPYRNAELIEFYNEVMRKYGPISQEIRRKTIYEEVGRKFFLNWQTAARIINKNTKCKNRNSHCIE